MYIRKATKVKALDIAFHNVKLRTWWRHGVEMLSSLLSIFKGNHRAKKKWCGLWFFSNTRFFHKHSICLWFETPWQSWINLMTQHRVNYDTQRKPCLTERIFQACFDPYKSSVGIQQYLQKAQGVVSIRKTVLPGMAIPMLKIRRPNGRLIFNMEIAIRR